MKRIALITGFLFFQILVISAQKYVVTSITGHVTYEDKARGTVELKLRQTLQPATVLNLSYKAQVELLDGEGQKKYVLKVPGRGAISEMLKDRDNSVMKLTGQYLAYVKARLKGKGEMTSRRHSDPATVTREIAVKKDDYEAEFAAFRQQAKKEYAQFRKDAIKEYAEFMRKAWQPFEARRPIPAPKNEQVPPVVAPVKEKEDTVAFDKLVKIDGAPFKAPAIVPQPVPPFPIIEQEVEVGEYVDFELYGTPLRVRFTGKEQFSLPQIDEKTVADVFEKLQSDDFNNTIRDVIELRVRHQLSDWAYLKMLDAFSKACFSTPDEATLLMAFLYQQTGYKMRLGVSEGQLCMLFASSHCIFNHNYYMIDGETFYPYEKETSRMKICEAVYPDEKPLSLYIPQVQMLAENHSDVRELKSKRYPDMAMTVSVNTNLVAFYKDYPASKLVENPMSQWTTYANTPLEDYVSESLMPALKEKIEGLSEKEKVERLLNWVQTAFVYEYDDKVWGGDRIFFAEETLYYPYCDCEDRSILLSRLVRDLVGLKTVLVYYPGHLAMAVGFTEDVKGDYILLDHQRFVVCDPTYIGARAGNTMPGMNNEKAKVILLE